MLQQRLFGGQIPALLIRLWPGSVHNHGIDPNLQVRGRVHRLADGATGKLVILIQSPNLDRQVPTPRFVVQRQLLQLILQCAYGLLNFSFVPAHQLLGSSAMAIPQFVKQPLCIKIVKCAVSRFQQLLNLSFAVSDVFLCPDTLSQRFDARHQASLLLYVQLFSYLQVALGLRVFLLFQVDSCQLQTDLSLGRVFVSQLQQILLRLRQMLLARRPQVTHFLERDPLAELPAPRDNLSIVWRVAIRLVPVA